MTRKYSRAIEGESGSYGAYVPQLQAILVTGQSLDELTARAREAIRVYWEPVRSDLSPTSMVREIEVASRVDCRWQFSRPLPFGWDQADGRNIPASESRVQGD